MDFGDPGIQYMSGFSLESSLKGGRVKKLLKEIKFDAEFIKEHTLQPQWYKILKVFLILGFLIGYYLLFGGIKTLIFCAVFFGLSLVIHLLYRAKTHQYTRSWLDFKVSEIDGQLAYQRIGLYYYLMVGINLILALLASQLAGS